MEIKRIKISDIKGDGIIKHSALSEELIERIKAFKQVLVDVEKIPLEQTIDNFLQDTNPEREIRIWEKIASAYQSFISENLITDTVIKKEIYWVALSASTGEDNFSNIKKLNKNQIERIVYLFSLH